MTTPGPETPYDSTLQHCELLYGRITKLTAALLEAEAQLLHRLATDYRQGSITAADVYAVYQQYKLSAPSGFSKRWDAAMPSELTWRRIGWTVDRFSPDPDGNWRGNWDQRKFPPRGINVVYVLFDAENVPCYVGSTGDFRTRVEVHRKDKPFYSWLAYPCGDREAAYRLEERLLLEHKPYLNRRTGR